MEWMLDLVRQQWAALGMTSPTLMPPLASDRLWRWLAEFPADVQISVLPDKLVATIAAIEAIVPDAGIVAHAADGVIRVQLPPPSPLTPLPSPLFRRLRAVAAAQGGRMVVRKWPSGVATFCAKRSGARRGRKWVLCVLSRNASIHRIS